MPILKINNFFLVTYKNILYICLRNLKIEIIMKIPSQKKIDIIYHGSIIFFAVIIATALIYLNLKEILK